MTNIARKLLLGLLGGGGGGSGTIPYTQTVLATQTANLVAYWPLSEIAGATADNAEGTAARDGAYDGAVALNNTPFDALTGAPYFDGTTGSEVNIYSASLAAAVDLNNITLMAWVKVAAAEWIDGAIRTAAILGADGNNRANINKSSTNGSVAFEQRGTVPGNDFNTLTAAVAGGTQSVWIMLLLTCVGGGNLSGYVQGASAGAPLSATSIAGALASTSAFIGGYNGTTAQKFKGHIAHVAVWKTVLSGPEILALYTAANPI
jgi:hypothetical protein